MQKELTEGLIACLREHASFKCIEGNEKRMVLAASDLEPGRPHQRLHPAGRAGARSHQDAGLRAAGQYDADRRD